MVLDLWATSMSQISLLVPQEKKHDLKAAEMFETLVSKPLLAVNTLSKCRWHCSGNRQDHKKVKR